MRVIAIDPNPAGLAELARSIQGLHGGSELALFTDPLLAVKYAMHTKIDALYTSVGMNRLDGFGVARMLRGEYPGLLVNFIADDDAYRRDAMRMGMNSYVVRPVTSAALRAAEDEIW